MTKNQITKFDKPMLGGFTAEVLTALAGFCEQHGLAVAGGNGTYSESSYELVCGIGGGKERNRKGRDIGYALTISSCEGANSVDACTVTAP
jgi:hypothetical protein